MWDAQKSVSRFVVRVVKHTVIFANGCGCDFAELNSTWSLDANMLRLLFSPHLVACVEWEVNIRQCSFRTCVARPRQRPTATNQMFELKIHMHLQFREQGCSCQQALGGVFKRIIKCVNYKGWTKVICGWTNLFSKFLLSFPLIQNLDGVNWRLLLFF